MVLCLFSKYNCLCFIIILGDLRQVWSVLERFHGIRTINHSHAGQNWKCFALNDHKLNNSVVLNTLTVFLMLSHTHTDLWWSLTDVVSVSGVVFGSLHTAGRHLRAAADGGAQGFRGNQVQIFIIRDLVQVISVLQQLPAQVWMNLRTDDDDCLTM